MINTRKMLADTKFYEGYSRFDEKLNRYESWKESVARVMQMHKKKYNKELGEELSGLFDYAQSAYDDQLVLGAQRALQFGGSQLEKHNIKMYNCVSSYADRPEFFQECMYMLLCGAGAGFSVQQHHVDRLPDIEYRSVREAEVFKPEDSIEGWADCIGVLLSSYLQEDPTFPEFWGKKVFFDLTGIRPKGSMISGGFKAPGPEPLRNALIKIEALLEDRLDNGEHRLRPIDVYDICMHAADAVISGGVRRSATICLFSHDDDEMASAKTGNWFVDNPQRGRSNNSAVIIRDQITEKEFRKLMKQVEEFGEPGFIFTDSTEFTYNPCVEIGKYPMTLSGFSGWQGCNLCEINGGQCTDKEIFFRACKAAAILGTLQAGYTDFKYLSGHTKEIFEREALIGVSVTGWMNNPDILFNEDILAEGADIVKYWNKQVAWLIGINPAARTTCVKPSGNASVLLGTASGIHGEHAPRYFRHMQLNKDTEVSKLLMEKNPCMIEESVWSANGTDYVLAMPDVAPSTSIFKKDLLNVKQLEYVKKAQQVWVENGTNIDLCVDPRLRHNVSNTIVVDDWEEVTAYVFENRDWFAGISFLAASGDKDYAQAPFTEVLTMEEIVEEYGVGCMFASGLIVEALRAFDENLWAACEHALGIRPVPTTLSHKTIYAIDWIRRADKFATKYFDGDVKKMTYCLKDVQNLHKWEKITKNMVDIDWAKELKEKEFTDIDTMGAQACSGGACDIVGL